MNRSTNYNFYLPESSDIIQVSQFDYNFETIDTNLKTHYDQLMRLAGTGSALLISNINDATDTGLYYTSNTASNRPADYCMVYTFASQSTTLSQLALSVTSSRLFTRQYSNGSWKDWKEYALSDNVPTTCGIGTHSNISVYGVTGDITSGGNNAELFIPMNIASNVTSVDVTKIVPAVRHVGGGYLGGGNSNDLVSYVATETVSKRQSGIYVILTNNNGWNITNNTPLSGSAVISFTLS